VNEHFCVCFSESESTRVPSCHETAALPAANAKLYNTEVYYCISCTCYTPRRSEQNECYGFGYCLRLNIVSVCHVLLKCIPTVEYYFAFFTSHCIFFADVGSCAEYI